MAKNAIADYAAEHFESASYRALIERLNSLAAQGRGGAPRHLAAGRRNGSVPGTTLTFTVQEQLVNVLAVRARERNPDIEFVREFVSPGSAAAGVRFLIPWDTDG